MTITDGAKLIATNQLGWTSPQSWCDLGCGSGLFTLALATLLAKNSSIHAVDANTAALRTIPDEWNGVRISKQAGDLTNPHLSLPRTDGMLIANVLHFLPNREKLLKQIQSLCRYVIVVEYERKQSSPWGPYPTPQDSLRNLSQLAGYASIALLATRRSRFGGTMYSALLQSHVAQDEHKLG